MSFKIIKGPDATIVIVPPKIAAKPIGIISFDGLIFVFLDIFIRAGKNKAVAPIFCIKEDIRPTVPDTIASIFFWDVPAALVIFSDTTFIIPDLSIP